jgi:hypothetical protein
MRVHTLTRIDNRPISDDPREIVAFLKLRNELQRLPHSLDHHRRIGIERFFAIDNGSTDGSKEFLLAQPDCHVFITSNSMAEARAGVEWHNALMNEYGTNRWCLMLDADELFVYPGYESKSLSVFTNYLDRSGALGVFSFLLDMYGRGTVGEWACSSDRALLDVCSYFDGNYKWQRRLHSFPPYNIVGGPRLRTLFPHLHKNYNVLQTIWRISYFTKLPLPRTLRQAPILMKIPLVRWLPGVRFETVHLTTPIKLSAVTGLLLHFKFMGDFYAHARVEVDRKEYVDGAREQRRYLAWLERDSDLCFYNAESVAYEGSNQLIRLGLMREDQEWAEIRKAADVPIAP